MKRIAMASMAFGVAAALSMAALAGPAPTPAPATPAATPAVAANSPANLVKYRQSTMGGVGKHMGLMGMVVKGEIDRKQDLTKNAVALHDLSLGYAELFPAGTDAASGMKTDAKPEVWTKMDDFKLKAKALEDESAKLVEVSKGGDFNAFKAQYEKLGEACGSCHETYKVKRQ